MRLRSLAAWSAALALAMMALPVFAAAVGADYSSSVRTIGLSAGIKDVAVWNDTLLYQDAHDKIVSLDMGTNRSMELDEQAKLPRLSGHHGAWSKGMSNTLVIYDLLTGTRLDTGVNNVTGISMSGGRIALSRFEHDPYTNGSISNIYVYDIANSTMASVSLYPSNKMNPCIFGDVVVWQDSRRGDKDVFMFDLTSKIERSVADGPGDQVYPRVWGDWIVYKDQSSTPSRTIAYSISGRTVTTVSTEGGGFPLIYGDRIIYTISGTYLFDLADNRSAKISEKNVARCIWENRIVDIDDQGILLLQFEPKEESGVVLSDVLPYVLIAALVVGGGGACAAMLWMDEGGSKKKGGG